jgi:hypothetical protein
MIYCATHIHPTFICVGIVLAAGMRGVHVLSHDAANHHVVRSSFLLKKIHQWPMYSTK